MFQLFRKKTENDIYDNHMKLGGMYVLGVVFIALIAALMTVQANVQYELRDERLTLLPKDQLYRVKNLELSGEDEQALPADVQTLVVYEAEDVVSQKSINLIEPVLNQMQEPYKLCEAGELSEGDIGESERIVIAVSHFQKLSASYSILKKWVKSGGDLMILYAPEKNGSFESMYDICGIKDSGDNILVEGVHFVKDIMPGGQIRDYLIEDSYESSREVSLTGDCEVFIESVSDHPVPILWRRNVGFGTVVFDNFGIMEKAYRGLHCAAYSLMGDVCVYPVINGAAFYIDDFPSPIPEGDAQYITRDYNMSISDFYSQVWWNDVYDMGKRHGVYYTGLVIENYNDQVTGQFERQTDVSRFLLFGNMLLEAGGEIGIHGYNHMPLVLRNFDYQDMYDGYVQWSKPYTMKNSLNEVIDFSKELFPEEQLRVYVPPSNVLSAEGRDIISTTPLRVIASVYLPADLAYAQEFDVSAQDGIVNTPRIVSGYRIDDYMYLAALSELTFHYVSTHFQHPDDVLDEDRGAAEGWPVLSTGLEKYMDWLGEGASEIRYLTGSELAAAVQRYDLTRVARQWNEEENKLNLSFSHFEDEEWMMVRLGGRKRIDSVEGGTLTPVTYDLYLLKADRDQVEITFK
ncbi:MAG: DUF2194 domain-containing protein [Lachnospiraceae bacterium]|nr:DUF2194 domain-containing protein [Lachnospiraceae bacterium]